MQPVSNFFRNPNIFVDALVSHYGQWLPDSMYIKLRFRFQQHKKLNLKNPRTFQEKLQWLKLYDHNPVYTRMVDKVLVKDYVTSKIGHQYVIPLLGVWDKPEEINRDVLPNSFVLKTNHSGGNTGVVICRDKSSFDWHAAIKKLNKSLRSDIYQEYREWPYKNIVRRVFAEKYIETIPEVKDLTDYKWYCFNGEPKFCQVIQGRTSKETIDFFDTEWNHQEFVGLNPVALPSIVQPSCPFTLETQLTIAKELSDGLPFVRVDLYEVGKKTFFGELTFYPMSGMGSFRPEQYNEILGQMLVLPKTIIGK